MRQPIQRSTEGLCGICRCRDAGYGVRDGHGPLIWVCDDPECLQIGRNSISLRQDTFNKLEKQAVIAGGAEAGQYLEAIGKTDLATLTEAEWDQFCEHLVGGYRHALKQMVKGEVAPF